MKQKLNKLSPVMYNETMLPYPPASFYGRDRELRELASATGKHRVILIAGIAGIGKTSLTLKLAHFLNDSAGFHNRVIYIPARQGWNDCDLAVEIINRVVELSGEKSYITRTGTNPQSVLDMIENLRIAVLIDDFQLVENETTRLMVLKAKSCLNNARLIISSRKRLSLDPLEIADIFELRLEGLSNSDACGMISRLLEMHTSDPPPQDMMEDVFSLVGGHPYSLKLFLSLLITGEYSLDTLLSSPFFSKERERTLLSKVWDSLDIEEKQLIMSLSVLRIPVKPDDFSFLMPGKMREVLRRLLEKYLVDRLRNGLITLHDLLRSFAMDQLSPEAKNSLHLKIADYYTNNRDNSCVNLKEAYYHFQAGGEMARAIDSLIKLCREIFLLGLETENIFHLIDAALKDGRGYRSQDLYRARIQLLVYWRRYVEAERDFCNIESLDELNFLKGRMHFRKGEFSKAAAVFEQLLEQPVSAERRADILGTLALCCNNTGHISRADEFYRRAEKETDQIAFPLISAKNSLNYAIFLSHRGQLAKALEVNEKAVRVFKDHNAQGRLANALYNRAIYFFENGDINKSRECLSESQEIKKRLNDQYGLLYNSALQGELYCAQGRYDQALREFRSAFETALHFNWIFPQAFLSTSIGNVYTLLRKFTESEFHLQKALELFSTIDYPQQQMQCGLAYSLLLLAGNRYQEAVVILTEVRAFAEKCEQPELLADCLHFLSLKHHLSGEHEKASETSEEFRKQFSQLTASARERITAAHRRFEELALGLPGIRTLIVVTRRGSNALPQSGVEESFPRKAFEFYANFDSLELYVDSRRIPFFKKKTLVELLLRLARDPGQIVMPDELFLAVWKRTCEEDSDRSNLRMSIARLRKLLDAKDLDRFIRSSDESSGYFFNPQTEFCVVFPAE
ncbi:MAG: winged helix-turn-helix domain-containing protein [Candidatus Wallbacteria bacterium]|nr:winged helix-turn-helix domain-containing protein [Candidatus Wallbacteria bacterium]